MKNKNHKIYFKWNLPKKNKNKRKSNAILKMIYAVANTTRVIYTAKRKIRCTIDTFASHSSPIAVWQVNPLRLCPQDSSLCEELHLCRWLNDEKYDSNLLLSPSLAPLAVVMFPPICLFVCLSVSLSVCLSVC